MAHPGKQAARPSPPPDLAGTTVGRFHIRVRLGAGGMGEVYRAEDRTLKRAVAIKRLAPALCSDPDFRRRFLREAERASALNHQHIASVYDVFEQGGEMFLVMEYVEGRTWRQCLEQPLSVAEFLPLARQCAEALAAAHERGIVHCDIKPENIIVTGGGQVKILDFGVAKRLPRPQAEGPATETATSAGLSGTPAYMAPEVLQEQTADGRADLFSLGVVFYETLAGSNPFRAASFVDTAHRILHHAPAPLRSANPQVPPELQGIVARLLAKDRGGRYPGAAELARDLRALEAGAAPRHAAEWSAAGAGAATVTPATPVAAWAGKLRASRAVYVLGALVLALAVLLSVPRLRESVLDFLGLAPVPEQKHIAVLPFTNIGGDPAIQEFSDGLAETLTSKLTQLEQFQGTLRVVPFSEVRRAGIETAEAARRQYGVNLALTGSVQRTGDTVRLTANLVDTATLRQLRSQVFDDRMANVSLWQDDAVLQLAAMLELEIGPRGQTMLRAGGTDVSQAYERYLRGRGFLQRYEKEENLDAARLLFEQAVAADPRYALAHAGLCEAAWRKYELTRQVHWAEEAQTHCQQAVEQDGSLAPVRVTLGMVLVGTGKHDQAVRELEHAIRLDPVNAAAYRELGDAYQAQNKLAEAEATYRQAIRLRPSDWSMPNHLGAFLYAQGRYQEAAEQFRRVTEMVPDNQRGHSNLGAMYHLLGRFEDALTSYNRAIEITPDPHVYSNLGTVYFFRGRFAEAVPMFEKAAAMRPSDYVLRGNLADAYRWAPGQREKAPAAYARAIELVRQNLDVNPRDARARSSLALYLAKTGKTREAVEELDRARRDAPADVSILRKAVLVLHLAGRRAQALDALEQAVGSGYPAEILSEPELAGLRDDPRFQKIVSAAENPADKK